MITNSLQPETHSRFTTPVVASLVLIAGLIGATFYLLARTSALEDQVKILHTSTKSEIAEIRTLSAKGIAAREQADTELQKNVELTEAKSQQAAVQASINARRYADRLAKQLAEQHQKQLQTASQQLAQSNETIQQQLSSQIGEVKQAATQTTAQVSGIAAEVTNVKSTVASAKSEIDKILSDMRSVRGDLGMQSGLIATNSRELAALRKLGERDYIEFQIPRSKAPQRVGDIAVQLKKSDTKRNRFSLDLVADDKKVEKKDRTINEPVQFFKANTLIPYEIVVNEVRRDMIIGYLAIPKVNIARK